MKTKVTLFFLVCCVVYASGTIIPSKLTKSRSLFFNNDAMDVADFSVYYDLKTNETVNRIMPRPWYRPGWPLRFPFYGGPCVCDGMQCKCCTGVRVQAIGFDRQTCTILKYEPEQSTLDVEVLMQNSTVYNNTFSARNLPPVCIPIPVPYLPPGLVDMCIRLFDFNLMDQKLHICMDMDTRIDKAPVVILHFDCMDMGAGGVGLSKPGGGQVSTNSDTDSMNDPLQQDSDVYDTVTESAEMTTKAKFGNSIKYI